MSYLIGYQIENARRNHAVSGTVHFVKSFYSQNLDINDFLLYFLAEIVFSFKILNFSLLCSAASAICVISQLMVYHSTLFTFNNEQRL